MRRRSVRPREFVKAAFKGRLIPVIANARAFEASFTAHGRGGMRVGEIPAVEVGVLQLRPGPQFQRRYSAESRLVDVAMQVRAANKSKSLMPR